jgi:hypothetical protein
MKKNQFHMKKTQYLYKKPHISYGKPHISYEKRAHFRARPPDPAQNAPQSPESGIFDKRMGILIGK